MFNINELLAALDSKKKQLATDFVDLMTNPKEFIVRNQASQKESGDSYTDDLLKKLDKASPDPNALRAPPFADPSASPMDLYGGMSKAAIMAFHGGPHFFKKFDWNKIGTGEGFQTYGLGHYVAERAPTARSYAYSTARPKIVTSEDETVLSLNRLTDLGEPQSWAALAIKDQLHQGRKVDFDTAEAQLRMWSVGFPSYGKDLPKNKAILEGIELLKDWKKKGYKISEDRHFYDLELKWPDPVKEAAEPLSREHFLTLDAPLADALQPKIIRESSDAKNPFRMGREYYETLASVLGSYQEAVKEMQKRGIPGLKYFDALSRNKSDLSAPGSFNYVINSDDLIEILNHKILPPSRNR